MANIVCGHNYSLVHTIPVITLLSDLGTCHPAVSGAKMLLAASGATTGVVDISHRIPLYNIQQAAYVTQYAYRHFPVGTVHLLLVDVLLGERHRMLLAKVDDHYFIAPDNGVLSLAFGEELQKVWLCREFSDTISIMQWVGYAKKVINSIRQDDDINEHFSPFMIKEVAQIMVQQPIGARLDCAILYIDRYGNVAIDLTKTQFDELINDGPFSIKLPREKEITAVSMHYNDVGEGELLCRFNSMGYMEIAINKGSATATFELDVATDKGINYGMITVNF